MSKCERHNIDKECMAGCSAHPDNWYCPECDKERADTRRSDGESAMNKAKINGNVLEKAVISVFDEYCVPTIKSNEMVTGHFLMRKPPFINLYGSVSRTGFLLKIRGRKPIRIITQWQQVGGTADEKLPYVLANCLKFNKAFKTNSIIILDGDGFKPDAKEWLIREAKKCKGIKVYSLKQFISWANKYLEKVK